MLTPRLQRKQASILGPLPSKELICSTTKGLSSPVRRDWLAVLHPLHSGEGGHACLADQLDVLSHDCCHMKGLGFL